MDKSVKRLGNYRTGAIEPTFAGHPDRGCYEATIYLGEQSLCSGCPFYPEHPCIWEDMRGIERRKFLGQTRKGQQVIMSLCKNGSSPSRLAQKYGIPKKVIEAIVNEEVSNNICRGAK